ncbi:ABC1 kinase family protein [Tuberibacillus sp. Marseille-P3662]|uniref:ABC1 kinase family protein n=1 Tax=Tuberibacillus sp. Marseille-P3662 TaxID=1965358 RepID=UPI000A1CF151|nr:AarF/ABC1/UbiB kinase family protein [Tuberibacillus sp. Marseille-P3662]
MLMKRMRHINRYREVATALVKYGFGYIVKEVGLFHLLSLPKKMAADLRTDNAKSIGVRVRLLMEELGPTFIKLGQLLSLRVDLIPRQLTQELEKLQDEISPVDSEFIKQTIEEELGAPTEELFQTFENTSTAAASIGQVHKATLQTGEDVVVKVRRPRIEAQVENDIEILRDLARLVEQHFSWARHYQLRDIVDEVATAIKNEMDYTQEGRNTEKVGQQFANDRNILIPSVYWEYSTKKVLTTSFIEGKKLRALEDLPADSFNRKVLANRIVHSFLNQVLLSGFYHGDPHTGNMFFLPGNKVAYIDFGQVGILSHSMKHNLASFVIGLMKKDTDILMNAVREMSITPEDIDEKKLRADLDELRDKYYDVPLSEINIQSAVTDIFNTTQKHQIIIPKDYTLLGKSLMTIESIVTELDPELSMIHLAEPYGKKLLLERLHPKNAAAKLWDELTDLTKMLYQLPYQVSDALTKMNRGETKFEMQLPQIDQLLRKLDRVGNRLSFSITLLAFSIIMVGLIVGATFGNSILAKIPAIEIGFIISFLMFLWLIYSIFRSGRF